MPALSIMIKPASSMCNLRCKYCFYHSLAKDRESFSFGKMQHETVDMLVSKAIKFAGGDSIYFAFQGGEPLLAGIDYFKYFVKRAGELNTNHSTIYYALQTNGTLITEEWAKFFKENNFLLGVSLDGDADANKFRVDAEGKPTNDLVADNIGLLQDYGIEFNVLIVATKFTAKNVERVYRYHTSHGCKYLQFIPCLRPFGDKSENEMYMTNEDYEEFLIELFNLYVKDFWRGDYTSVRQMDNWVNLFLSNKVEQCGMMGHCTHQFVIEANGNVYPCDFYCTDEWLLGNINESDFKSLANSTKAIDFIKESLVYPDKCKSCKYFRMCRSCGCKRSRADRDYCEAYKGFFDKCLPLFRVFAGNR